MNILHMYTALDDGGVERFLLNYYQNMDRKKIRFDVVVPGKHVGILENEFETLGSKIFHIPRLREGFWKHIKMVYHIIKDGQYEVVHCHGYKSIIGLVIAWLCRVKVRIIHSHIAYENESISKKMIRCVVVFLCKVLSSYQFSCGIEAGKWLYGNKWMDQGRVKIIYNAINLQSYSFSDEKREEMRKQLMWENRFVIGNIARFSYQKNQEFLIDILRLIVKEEPRVLLALVGAGDSQKEIEVKVQEFGLQDHVVLMGARNDVPNLLSGMDYFVLPSRYEGLGIALIEAQAAGLQCIASTYVPLEAKITENVLFMDIDMPQKWADEILKFIHCTKLDNIRKKVHCTEYDIKVQAMELQTYYEKIVNDRG